MKIVLVAVLVLLSTMTGLAGASDLTWVTYTPSWKADKTGLHMIYTNKPIKVSRVPDQPDLLAGIMADVPNKSRQPDVIRVVFDLKPGYPMFGAGILISSGRFFSHFILIRDGDSLIVETYTVTNEDPVLFKKIRIKKDFLIQEKGNELVWNRKNGQIKINGRLLLQSPAVFLKPVAKIGLLGASDAVSYRRMRLQISDRAINSASQGMAENVVTMLDEIFDGKTRIRPARFMEAFQEDAGGTGDILGP